MFEKLKKILQKVDADYTDIRYEQKKDCVITFNGKELTRIGSNSTDGFVVRILKNGGLSSVAFTKETDADTAIRSALENAVLIGKNIQKPIQLAKVPVVKETFFPQMKEDPRKISISEKLELVRNIMTSLLKKKKL